MGLSRGMLSYIRCTVEGTLPNDFVERFATAMNLRRFRPLHEDGQDMDSAGWVSYMHEYAENRAIVPADFLFDDHLILSYREDSIRIPKAVLRSQVEKRFRDFKKEHPLLSDHKARKELEDAEMAKLRKRLLPKTKLVEAIWSLEHGQLRLLNMQRGVVERFMELFEHTFSLRLQELSYAVQAMQFENGVTNEQKGSLRPAPIFEPKQRMELH